MTTEQTIEVPLYVNSQVTLLTNVEMDDTKGFETMVTFSDTVTQYVPETGLLRFENSDIGRAAFTSMVEEADGIEIVRKD